MSLDRFIRVDDRGLVQLKLVRAIQKNPDNHLEITLIPSNARLEPWTITCPSSNYDRDRAMENIQNQIAEGKNVVVDV